MVEAEVESRTTPQLHWLSVTPHQTSSTPHQKDRVASSLSPTNPRQKAPCGSLGTCSASTSSAIAPDRGGMGSRACYGDIALKFVLLDGLLGKGRRLLCHLSPDLRKCHPLANDLPARFARAHEGSRSCYGSKLDADLLAAFKSGTASNTRQQACPIPSKPLPRQAIWRVV